MDLFCYTPITGDEFNFRLVNLHGGTGSEIQVDMIDATLRDEELIEYEALSYAWGSPEKPSWISVQGARLWVTNNLWHILQDLRLPRKNRLLWIDAICINQDSNEEKNHQVKQMGRIYNKAEVVLVYLGRSTDATNIVMQALVELQNQCLKLGCTADAGAIIKVWTDLLGDLYDRHYNFDIMMNIGIKYLLSQPWFQRMWIVQEVANARAARVYCGNMFVSPRFLTLGPQLLQIEPGISQQAIFDMLPKKRRLQSSWSTGQDLFQLLILSRKAEASLDHDKIFALLGMCTGGKGRGTMEADYNLTIEEVIRKAIAYMCFCEPRVVPTHLCVSISALISSLESLHNDILQECVTQSHVSDVDKILQHRGNEITITPSILSAAAADEQNGPRLIGILLEQYQKDLSLTIASVEEASMNETKGLSVLKIIKRYVNSHLKMTPGILEVAFGKGGSAKDLLRSLFDKWKGKVYVTPGMIKVFASSSENTASMRRSMKTCWKIDIPFPSSGTYWAEWDSRGASTLWEAVTRGDGAFIKLFIGYDIDGEASDQDKSLRWALYNGHETLVNVLRETGSHVDDGANAKKWEKVDDSSTGFIARLNLPPELAAAITRLVRT